MNAIQAMKEQRSFAKGGFVPSTGPIFAHKGEPIIPVVPSNIIQHDYPGFLDALIASKSTSDVDRAMQAMTQQTVTNQANNRTMSISNYYNYNYGNNAVTQNINGVDPSIVATKAINGLVQALPELMREANRKRGVKEER
jgi:hypothetical protein